MEGLQGSRIDHKKASAMSTGFQFLCQDDAASQFDIAFGDETDLEQDYITKLKTQRQRMEKLEKGYLQKQQQLAKQINHTNQLLQQISQLTTYIPYKQKHTQLSQDYNDLLSKYNIQQNQLQIVKQQLSQVLEQNGNTITRLKNQINCWKECSSNNAQRLQQSLEEREEEIRKVRREWKDKEEALAAEIKGYKNTISKLKSQLQSQSQTHTTLTQSLTQQLKSRECQILDLQKSLQHSRKTVFQLKSSLSSLSQQQQNRQQELTTICTKLKYQLNQAKKIINDKDANIEELNSEIKRYGAMLQEEKKIGEDLRIDFKKTCQLYQCGSRKMKYESQSEIGRLEAFVKELKDSIQELMEVKNCLMVQNRKLITVLKKKQQNQKMRKQLLRTQFKQIDRIQKVIDRLQ